jgi:putative FmdB family regulatory protein
MPTYEYRCKACGHELEAVQAFTDDPLTVCPECGGDLRKRFGAVGITFKGAGFYKTDSRSSGSSGPAKAGEGATPSGDGGATGGDGGSGTGDRSSSSTTSGTTATTSGDGGSSPKTPAGT